MVIDSANRPRHAIASAAGASVEMLEKRTLFTIYTVNSPADDGTAGTLRYEIGLANTAGTADGPQTITFNTSSTAQFSGNTATINLSSGTLLLDTSGTLNINAPGAPYTVHINVVGSFGAFVNNTNCSAELQNLEITGGENGSLSYTIISSGSFGEIVYGSGGGGGITNLGTLTVSHCTPPAARLPYRCSCRLRCRRIRCIISGPTTAPITARRSSSTSRRWRGIA